MNDKFLSYDDLKLTVLQCTQNPNRITSLACAMTQKKELDSGKPSKKLIRFLFEADHTSVFEHSFITFLIENVSRSFLAQITRHRMGSFTSASQHYQVYDSYPNILHPAMVTMNEVVEICDKADAMYSYLISIGIPKWEARQILPNAKAVNIIWTVNARSLINFFNKRLCKRNVPEMVNFAERLQEECLEWWPELFSLVGPDCITLGGCTQGRMQAEECINAGIETFKR